MIANRYDGQVPGQRSAPGVAFLLAQVGAAATNRFAAALVEHDLTPPLAGVLRILTTESGLSQQALSERLGAAPSRVVGYLDDLEARGWIVRGRNAGDRRVNEVALTDAGNQAFLLVAGVGRRHEETVTAALTGPERVELGRLLAKVAEAQGLTVGVHPGYRGYRG